MGSEPFLKRRLRSIRIALDGIKQVITTQENARIHVLATLVIWVVSILIGLSSLEWVILLLVMGLVWAAEIFNTAVEELVDLVSLEATPEAKRIKDISAGAVLISAIISILAGLLLFGPKLWALIVG